MPSICLRNRYRYWMHKDDIYWPSIGNFIVYIIPPVKGNPNYMRNEVTLRYAKDFGWFIDYLDGTCMGGFKKTEQKAVAHVLKILSIQSGVSVEELRDLMEDEAAIHVLSSLSM